MKKHEEAWIWTEAAMLCQKLCTDEPNISTFKAFLSPMCRQLPESLIPVPQMDSFNTLMTQNTTSRKHPRPRTKHWAILWCFSWSTVLKSFMKGAGTESFGTALCKEEMQGKVGWNWGSFQIFYWVSRLFVLINPIFCSLFIIYFVNRRDKNSFVISVTGKPLVKELSL